MLVVAAIAIGAVAVPGHESRLLSGAVCRVFRAAAGDRCAQAGPAPAGATRAGPVSRVMAKDGQSAESPISALDGCDPPVSTPHEQVPAQGSQQASERWVDVFTCHRANGATDQCTVQVSKSGTFTSMSGPTCVQTEPPPPVVIPPSTIPATAPEGPIRLATCSNDQVVGPAVGSPVTGRVEKQHVLTCTGTGGRTRQCERDSFLFFVDGRPDHYLNGDMTCGKALTKPQIAMVDDGADADYIFGASGCPTTALSTQAAHEAETAIPTTAHPDVGALMAAADQKIDRMAGFVTTVTGRDPRVPADRESLKAGADQLRGALGAQGNPAIAAAALDLLGPVTAPEPGHRGTLDYWCERQIKLGVAIILPAAVLGGAFLDTYLQWGMTVLGAYWTVAVIASLEALDNSKRLQRKAYKALRNAQERNASPAEIARLTAEVEAQTYRIVRLAEANWAGVKAFFARYSATVAPAPGPGAPVGPVNPEAVPPGMADYLAQMEEGIDHEAALHGFQARGQIFLPGWHA